MRAVNLDRGTVLAETGRRATSLLERSRGLLGRGGLEPDEGLVIDPCSAIHTFGMAFTIDAIFLDREGRVVHLSRELKPQRLSPYVLRARSVLELPAGTIARTGTEVGDLVRFED